MQIFLVVLNPMYNNSIMQVNSYHISKHGILPEELMKIFVFLSYINLEIIKKDKLLNICLARYLNSISTINKSIVI